MRVTTILASAGMLLLSIPAAITATAVKPEPSSSSSTYIQSTSIDHSTVVSNMHSSGHDYDGNYDDDYYDDDYYDDDYYDDEDDFLISSSNSTKSLSPRTMMTPYRPKIPDTWDRACLYIRGKNPLAINAKNVQVYSREFDKVNDKHCGKGLLDNLRGECGDPAWSPNRIINWRCRRMEKTGIFASFKISHLSSPLNRQFNSCVEIAFREAALAEAVPADILCCSWDDINCLNEAPGHDPRYNLLVPDEVWIGPGPTPTNFPESHVESARSLSEEPE